MVGFVNYEVCWFQWCEVGVICCECDDYGEGVWVQFELLCCLDCDGQDDGGGGLVGYGLSQCDCEQEEIVEQEDWWQ